MCSKMEVQWILRYRVGKRRAAFALGGKKLGLQPGAEFAQGKGGGGASVGGVGMAEQVAGA